MKKNLIMLPLVVSLLGCSVGYRAVRYHDVVAVPNSPPPYEWSYACYGYPCCTLQGCFGFGWMNPFYLYEFTLNYYPDWYYGGGEFHPGYRAGWIRDDYVRSSIRKDELSKGNPKARKPLPDSMSGWPADSPGSWKEMSIQPIGRESQAGSRESGSGSYPESKASSGSGGENRAGRKK